MTITPKSRFLEDKPRASKHRDMVVSSSYLAAAEAALLQVVDDMAESTDPAVAIAGYHRILGARKYMKAFAELAETPQVPQRQPDFNLNHKLK